MNYATATEKALIDERQRLAGVIRDAGQEKFLVAKELNKRAEKSKFDKDVSKMNQLERDALRAVLAAYP